MAAILQMIFLYSFSLIKIFFILIKILLKIVPNGEIGNNLALA